MKVTLVGGVEVSAVTLEVLAESPLDLCGVLGHEPAKPERVTGHTPLDSLAKSYSVPYLGFKKVNDPSVVEQLKSWSPDLLFVVGLSQILHDELLGVPTKGCVGFHPTKLPDGRGRAPVPWMILTKRDGASTFFLLDDGVDSGPILAQEPFDVTDEDYAEDVHRKIEESVRTGLKRLCERLASGDLSSHPQDESQATYCGRRGPEDGFIDWNQDADDIARLVRATSRPYPGAFCLTQLGKLVVWRAHSVDDPRHYAIPGTVLNNNGGELTVQAKEGQVVITEYSPEFDSNSKLSPLRVGGRLDTPIWDRLSVLEQRIAELTKRVNSEGDGSA